MFDLHVHTTASDGDLNAREIIEEAKKAGLKLLQNKQKCIEKWQKVKD